MKFILNEFFSLIVVTMCLKKCSSFGNTNLNEVNNFYYVKNQVLALREELKIDGIEEDTSFTGGRGVNSWLVLPTFSNTYLIGIKKRGLSLLTLNKKLGSYFQAFEKQIDIGVEITSVVAFNYLNPKSQHNEGIVIVSTDTPKFEIIWFKIQNYKLVRIWSWIRYSPTQSLHYFNVMREDRLLILESGGSSAYVYAFDLELQTPKIREIEIIQFEQKVLSLSVSLKLTEPFLYTLHSNELRMYRYKRFCSESWIGSFVYQTSLKNLGIRDMYPFHSEGKEYLALAGKDSGVLRIEDSGNIVPEMRVDNVLDWIIMKTGPNKDRILLFGKDLFGEISVFSNVGLRWTKHPTPSCYKSKKKTDFEMDNQEKLSCIKNKSWQGVASLEIGDLPTLIFAERQFYGEMYHVMVGMKRDVLPLDDLPFTNGEYSSYLLRMKSNLEGLVTGLEKNQEVDDTCGIFETFTTIERIAGRAKEKLPTNCARNSNLEQQIKYQYEPASTKNYSPASSVKENKDNKPQENKLEEEREEMNSESTVNVERIKLPESISPDMETDHISEIPNDFKDTNKIAGFPKIEAYN